MKPIELKLQAFGQYLTEQTVRFDRLDSVFLISGETGSGKTTLFDAMSFALYGRGLGTRASGIALRSQLAGPEESTVVGFRFAARGVEWLAERSPYQFVKYARTGTLQSDKYAKLTRLTGPNAPEVIAPGEVNAKIVSVIGLRYEDFSKILVLPQGEFQQFLAMKSAERATLLKTLFPVRQHEAIAAAAKESVRDIKTAVAAIDAVITDLQGEFNESRFDGDETALVGQVADLSDKEQLRQREQQAAQLAFNEATRLAGQIATLQVRQAEHQQHETTRQEQVARTSAVLAGQRAAAALPVVAIAETLGAELVELEKRLIQAGVDEKTAVDNLERLRPEHAALPQRQGALQQAVRETEALAVRIGDLRELDKARTSERKSAAEAERLGAASLAAVANVTAAEASVVALDRLALQREAAKPALIQAEAAVHACQLAEQDAKSLGSWQRSDAPRLQSELDKEQAALAARDIDVQAAEKALLAAQERLESDAALVVAAALRPGEPCPACGSPDHPRPHAGNTGEGDAVALVRSAETGAGSARYAQAAQGKVVAGVVARQESAAVTAQRADQRLQAAGFADPAAWQAARTLADAALIPLRKEDAVLAAKLATRPALVAALVDQRGLAAKAADLAQKSRNGHVAAATVVRERQERVGAVADPAAEWSACDQRRQEAVQRNDKETTAIAKLLAGWQDAEKAMAGAVATHEAHAKARDDKLAALPAARRAALSALQDAEFATASDARAAALTPAALAGLQQKVSAWDGELAAMHSRIADLEAAIAGRTAPDLAAAEDAQIESSRAAKAATERRAAAQLELAALRDQARKLKEKREERARVVADAQGLLTLSKHLNGEIAPKIDFATWMLTWWLERVLLSANSRLRALSDGRYLFALRTETKDGRQCAGLDVDVRDTWSNQLRDVNILSGGEKFLASLSLALGLADVVQGLNGGVQLDTLFIDEGFGSLDAATLDRAMELVHSIAKHRAVGLISHVEAMQKTITSQIRVTKSPRGSTVHVGAAAG